MALFDTVCRVIFEIGNGMGDAAGDNELSMVVPTRLWIPLGHVQNILRHRVLRCVYGCKCKNEEIRSSSRHTSVSAF